MNVPLPEPGHARYSGRTPELKSRYDAVLIRQAWSVQPGVRVREGHGRQILVEEGEQSRVGGGEAPVDELLLLLVRHLRESRADRRQLARDGGIHLNERACRLLPH